MTALTDPQRAQVWAEYMQETSADREALTGIVKADLRAAINAIDDWLEANLASLNSAIPQPARGALNQRQKARLLLAVIMLRYPRA